MRSTSITGGPYQITRSAAKRLRQFAKIPTGRNQMKTRRTTVAGLLLACLLAVGCHHARSYNLPPAERLMHPGPGVSGPGPGVLPPDVSLPVGPMGAEGALGETQVLFSRPEGMQVRWEVAQGAFSEVPLIVPGRNNFQQGGIYRLKLTNIPNREGVELYPTLEIGPATPRTEAFLAHNALPVQITPEDFDQVLTGNFVTKVIYLPDPEFQELALAGVETLVSTRLEPGVDPVVEADRRGAILGIIRLGNKDVEMPSTGGMGEGEVIEGGIVVPASHGAQGSSGAPVPFAVLPAAHGSAPTAGHHGQAAYGSAQLGGAYPPSHVAGLTTPSWGMPITGTPIGLPGPAHIPLGHPAGLKKHTIYNHTKRNIPEPTSHLRFDVKQHPGQSYPAPPHRAWVHEKAVHASPSMHQPHGDMHHHVP